MSNQTPSFRSILAKLKEATESNHQIDEIFGGLGSAVGRATVNKLTPTAMGKGKQLVDTQANNLLKAWQNVRGQSGLPNTGSEISNWIKSKLGEENPKVWEAALANFKNQYAASYKKFENPKSQLDKMEVLNFLVTFIKSRNYVNAAAPVPVAPIEEPTTVNMPYFGQTIAKTPPTPKGQDRRTTPTTKDIAGGGEEKLVGSFSDTEDDLDLMNWDRNDTKYNR